MSARSNIPGYLDSYGPVLSPRDFDDYCAELCAGPPIPPISNAMLRALEEWESTCHECGGTNMDFDIDGATCLDCNQECALCGEWCHLEVYADGTQAWVDPNGSDCQHIPVEPEES